MRIEPAALAGVYTIERVAHQDERGYFARSFCRETFRKAGLVDDFAQWSLSFNRKRGTIRGMHFQRAPYGETKIVRACRGAIFDVMIDVRPGSSTRGRWIGVELSAANGRQVYIPDGFAHGFQTLEDETEIEYAISVPFTPNAGAGYRHDDPAFAIAWPLPVSVIAEKDEAWPDFDAVAP